MSSDAGLSSCLSFFLFIEAANGTDADVINIYIVATVVGSEHCSTGGKAARYASALLLFFYQPVGSAGDFFMLDSGILVARVCGGGGGKKEGRRKKYVG